MNGDRTKTKERDAIIHAFVSGQKPVLIATDGALRNLELAHVETVISYDIAPSLETYVHRLEFTGQRGHTGTAITLVTESSNVDECTLAAAASPSMLDSSVSSATPQAAESSTCCARRVRRCRAGLRH